MPAKTRKFKTQAERQHAAMWSLVRSKMSDEDFRELIFDLTNGKSESSSALNFDQKNYVIEKLGGTPFVRSRRDVNRQRAKTGVKNIDTGLQEKLLNDLWFKFPHRTANGFESMCLRQIKREKPVTTHQFNTMIETVKAMNARETQQPTTKEAA